MSINRIIRILVIVMAVLILLLVCGLLLLVRLVDSLSPYVEEDRYKCPKEVGTQLVNELCLQYHRGEVTGSLCEPLCNGDIQVLNCYGFLTNIKQRVIRASWKQRSMVILKTYKPVGYWQAKRHLRGFKADAQFIMSTDELTKRINSTLYRTVMGRRYDERMLETVRKIVSECDIGQDGKVGYNEVLNCWGLVECEEFTIFSLLSGRTTTVPEVYGVCGNMYSVEYLPMDIRGSWPSYKQSWRDRIKKSIALLDMLVAFEETPYGPLHLCDIKGSNFGLVENKAGELVAKAIDLDCSWFGDVAYAARYEPTIVNRVKCESNADCQVFFCFMECDPIKGRCTRHPVNNNLQVMCEKIFLKSPVTYWYPPLLEDPPESIARKLRPLLLKCANPRGAQPFVPRKLLNELRSLLVSSVN